MALNVKFLYSKYSTDLKGPIKIIDPALWMMYEELGRLHGTTPAAVTANKIEKFDPLEAVETFKRK